MEINLALFYDPGQMTAEDMATICGRIGPGIRTYAFPSTDSHLLTPVRLCTRPTVTVEFGRPGRFHPIRGKRLRQLRRGKIATNGRGAMEHRLIQECLYDALHAPQPRGKTCRAAQGRSRSCLRQRPKDYNPLHQHLSCSTG